VSSWAAAKCVVDESFDSDNKMGGIGLDWSQS
jgi:hypothetical protein